MPESREAPVVQDVDLNQAELVTSLQEMRDAYALSLVRQTFHHYDTFRQQNHDARWNVSDGLYLGWIPQRVWDGTNIPRSSLSWPIVFDQIETAIPTIMQALFGGQNDWFQVEADAGGDPQAARAVKSHLSYAFEHNNDSFGLTALNDFELAIKSLLTYGNGGVAIEWDATKRQPVISWVDNRDIYFDPAAAIPAVDYCRSVIRRSLKTVDEVLSWKDIPGMKIPSKEVLWNMAQNQQTSAGDQTKQNQSALLGYTQHTGFNEVIPLPADRQIEILTYYSKDRIIIVLNRQWVAFVEKNPYGFIPLAFAPCYIVPGKFYALSIADVQEGNQRYAEALLNGRIDEIHLALHPPRVQKANAVMTPNQQKWAPGRIFRVNDPKNDLALLTPAGATTQVYDEIQMIQLMSEKRTGLNAMASGGIPTPSNANRTGMGMQMQMQGVQTRLQMIVRHIEDYMLVPALYKMYKILQVHNNTPGFVPGLAEGGNVQQINTAAFRGPVRFKIRASSQMLTRTNLSQIFPFLIQYLTAGPFIQGLAQTGMAVDWSELLQMLQDATGIDRSYRLVRQMTEQEQQQLNQPPPEVVAEQQKTQQESQLRLQIAQMSTQADLQKAMIQKQPDPMELQREQMKMEMEAQREQMKLAVEQQKMEMERQKAEMQLQLKRIEMQMKLQEAQMNAILGQREAEQSFALKSQQAQMDAQLSQQQHAANLQQTQEQAALKTEQAQVQHQLALQQAKEKMALRPVTGSQVETKARQPKPKSE